MVEKHDLTFELEGWSGCIKDTIIVKRDGKTIYTGDYDRYVDYNDAVKAIENGIREISNQKNEEQLVEVGDICGMFES